MDILNSNEDCVQNLEFHLIKESRNLFYVLMKEKIDKWIASERAKAKLGKRVGSG